MNVSCPQCSTVYRVDPAKVPQGGVRARCSTCSGVIPVGIADVRRPTPTDLVGAAFGARPAPPFAPGQRAATPARPAPARPTPARPTPARAAPARATPASPAPAMGAALPPLRPTPPAGWASVATPQPPAAAPVSVPPVTPPPAAPDSAPETAAGAPASRRPTNPFLARDPSLRARRLARALVSDMVAYYPAKHAEGLEKGTLRELFREEIKKSYDEYVAQVGSDYARTTAHFQESLNEVLGAGRKIF